MCMTITSLRLPKQMIVDLQMAACREGLRRGRRVTVSEMAREVFEEHILSRDREGTQVGGTARAR